jgi:hypothetical protein
LNIASIGDLVCLTSAESLVCLLLFVHSQKVLGSPGLPIGQNSILRSLSYSPSVASSQKLVILLSSLKVASPRSSNIGKPLFRCRFRSTSPIACDCQLCWLVFVEVVVGVVCLVLVSFVVAYFKRRLHFS